MAPSDYQIMSKQHKIPILHYLDLIYLLFSTAYSCSSYVQLIFKHPEISEYFSLIKLMHFTLYLLLKVQLKSHLSQGFPDWPIITSSLNCHVSFHALINKCMRKKDHPRNSSTLSQLREENVIGNNRRYTQKTKKKNKITNGLSYYANEVGLTYEHWERILYCVRSWTLKLDQPRF